MSKVVHRFLSKGKPTNVLMLVKCIERYVFLYDYESTAELLQTLGRYAADPELSLTWYDAAVLSQRAREHGESR